MNKYDKALKQLKELVYYYYISGEIYDLIVEQNICDIHYLLCHNDIILLDTDYNKIIELSIYISKSSYLLSELNEILNQFNRSACNNVVDAYNELKTVYINIFDYKKGDYSKETTKEKLINTMRKYDYYYDLKSAKDDRILRIFLISTRK